MGVPTNEASVQGQGVKSADALNTYAQGCTTAAQLRAFVGLSNMEVYLLGIASVNDGQAGMFYWNATSTAADDNLDVIAPNGVATGRWLRVALPTPAPPTTTGVAFRVSLTDNITAPFASTSNCFVPFDSIDFDTNDGFNPSYAGPGPEYDGNSYPTYIVPVAGIYLFQAQTWFQETTDRNDCVYQGMSHTDSAGNLKATYASASGAWAVTVSEGSSQFSQSFSNLVQCEAGDLLFTYAAWQLSPDTTSTLNILGTGGPDEPFVDTFFCGAKVA